MNVDEQGDGTLSAVRNCSCFAESADDPCRDAAAKRPEPHKFAAPVFSMFSSQYAHLKACLLEMMIFNDLVIQIKNTVLVGVKVPAGCARHVAVTVLAGAVRCCYIVFARLESAAVFSNLFVGSFTCSHGNHSFRVK